MKLLCLACPKNACFLLPLQSKHGVTQLLPNIYPCPKLPKIHPISPGFNIPTRGHWHRTKSRVEFCFDAFSALSRQPANWGTKRKTRLGIPQWVGLWALDDGWWTGAAHSRVASALTARVWGTAPARGKTKAADCRSSATKLRRQMLTSVNPRKVEGQKTIKL